MAASKTCLFALVLFVGGLAAAPLQGTIEIVTTRGDQSTSLLYSLRENFLRIEVTGSSRPDPIDVVDLKSGELTLIYPHNRSFVRLKSKDQKSTPASLNVPPMPIAPSGIGAQPNKSLPTMPPIPTPPGGLPAGSDPQSNKFSPDNMPPGVGPQSTNSLGVPPALPSMHLMMPPMMNEKIELKPTGKKDKIFGYECEQFEIKQRGETMEIWATDQLLPFQYYLDHEPHRLGPRMLEEQWPELLKAKKLFPLRASLRFDNGTERFHFEVKSITPEKLADKDGKLFQPPEGYTEIQPLAF